MNRSSLRADALPFQAPPHLQQQNQRITQPIAYGSSRPQLHPHQSVPFPGQANSTMAPMMFGTVPVMPPFGPMLQGPAPQMHYNVGAHPGAYLANGQGSLRSSSGVSSRGSSGPASASISSQSSPHSIPSSTTSDSSQQCAVTPAFLGQFPIIPPGVPPAKGQQQAPEIHRHLDSALPQYCLHWVIGTDPGQASYHGRRLPYKSFFDWAFKQPRHTIFVAVGLHPTETRGFPVVSPEDGMRLISFRVSVPTDDLSLPKHQLDLHNVLDGIRLGINSPMTKDLWVGLTLQEKLTLAKRLSSRRSVLQKLLGFEFLEAAVEFESKYLELEKRGTKEVSDVVKEAHKLLDSYVFNADFCSGPTGVRECLKVGDLLGGRKIFKGLKWMNWRPIGDIEAFFLCVD